MHDPHRLSLRNARAQFTLRWSLPFFFLLIAPCNVWAQTSTSTPASSNTFFLPIQVIDEQKRPIDRAEGFLIRGDDLPLSNAWVSGRDGKINVHITDIDNENQHYSGAAKVVVRARGYAASEARVTVPRNETLTLQLSRGTQFEVVVRPPPGFKLPEDLVPICYPANDCLCGWLCARGWKHGDDTSRLFDVASMERVGEGRFAFRVQGSEDFCIMISHPGFIRAFEAGPFKKDETQPGKFEITLPTPGALRAKFGNGEDHEVRAEDSPMTLELGVSGFFAPGDRGFFPLNADTEVGGLSRVWTDLAPGTYMVTGREGSAAGKREKGQFRENRAVEVVAGKESAVDISFKKFDEQEFRTRIHGDY